MFTGIVREVGTIEGRHRGSRVTSLSIAAPRLAGRLSPGDSLAVNGVCLTVTSGDAARVTADVSPETRRVTTAGRWTRGDRVHLEPALGASDPIGGHFVLGHVDGVGVVRLVRKAGATREVSIEPPLSLIPFLAPKGSVAVDGVSLTLDSGPFVRTFTLTLIPQTLRETRFATLVAGDRVNVEIDMLAKAVAMRTGGAAHRGHALSIADITSRGWQR